MNCPQHNHNQQGSVALIMVIVLATMGLLLLKNLHYYQNRMLLTLAKEQRYFQAFNQAESALAWGKRLIGKSIFLMQHLGYVLNTHRITIKVVYCMCLKKAFYWQEKDNLIHKLT